MGNIQYQSLESDAKVSDITAWKSNLKLALSRNLEGISDVQRESLSVLGDYKDLLVTDRAMSSLEDWRKCYTVHSLNHVLKTRTKILNNNAKHEARDDGDDKLRDQGFTRPKVLIVVPFKESCRRIVEILIGLMFPDGKARVSNRKRFNQDYQKIVKARKDKPDDYYETFEGDIDDSFKLGLSVTKKSLKLYTDFYSSDIIISSPLGLRLVTGVEGEVEEKGTDSDFLSSIEVLVVDQCDVLLMQNWSHLSNLLLLLNRQPKSDHGVDFSRVRSWCLDGHSRLYRQSVLLSNVPFPELSSLWNSSCTNYAGRRRSCNPVPGSGALSTVLSEVPLVWHRVDVSSLKESVEGRMKYFTEKVMPRFKGDGMDHTLVFVPSYFDFVKIRNWFKSSDLDFSEISEYSKDARIAKARDEFYHNEKHFLLYTERAHFYRRFRLKGVRHLIIYQPPSFPGVFTDLANMLRTTFQNPRGGSDANMSITILHTRYDVARLNLCVGSENARNMLSSEKSIHKLSPSVR